MTKDQKQITQDGRFTTLERWYKTECSFSQRTGAFNEGKQFLFGTWVKMLNKHVTYFGVVHDS